MKKRENNYAFIDSQNLNLSIQSLGWKLDFARFRVYLKEKYGVSNAFLFVGYVEGNNNLYTSLQSAGFICIFKPTLTYKDGTIKGNVDAELVLHTMIQLPRFDKAIIVTGDGDFYCLVQYLLEQNKLGTVLVPNQLKYSALLKRFARKHIAFMNDLQNKLTYKKEGGRK
ncbi:MAG: NYN domain-containing protein [Patescibacteria group bacterium]